MILEKLNELIEFENETFNQLTNAEKRVAIAKDCIVRIKLEQLKPFKGIVFSNNGSKEGLNDDLKTVLNTTPISCSVCAKGALFLSYVGRTNKTNSSILEDNVDNNFNNIPHSRLLEIFTHRQIALIETAFEGRQYLWDYNKGKKNIIFSDLLKLKIEKFYDLYRDDNDRLLRICENIIKNKGTFKL